MMSKEFYVSLNARISSKKHFSNLIKVINAVVTSYMFVLYPASCVCFLISAEYKKLLLSALLCGSGFVLVSLMRRVFSRKRPYEELSYTPVLKGKKKSDSMPSRHTFSVFVISLSSFLVSPWLCFVNLFLAICLALCRILGGVHYVSDVVAGALIALVFGALFLFI